MYRIGFDVGGTKIKLAILDSDNNVVFEHIAITSSFPEGVYDTIGALYQLALIKINGAKHSVGIGIPGNSARPTYLFEGTDIFYEITRRVDRDVKIDNDANCFVLAESMLGAGRGADSVFGIILGTGVGGGVVINKQLYHGNSGLAGEWGHTPLHYNGIPCWCGQKGCAEQYISGRAIERTYRNNSNVLDKSATEIFNINDVVSICIKENFYNDLAQGIANIINYYDPEVVVIGGGLSDYDEIYEVVPARVANLIFNTKLNARIVKNMLGADAGAIGAALL